MQRLSMKTVTVPGVPPVNTTPCLPSGPGAVLDSPTMRCSHVLFPSAMPGPVL